MPGFEPGYSAWESHRIIDLQKYKQYLNSKYSKHYAWLLFGYAKNHLNCLQNPQALNELPVTKKGNVLKAMVCLSKYLGVYDTYKAELKQYGIKWTNTDDAFNSFLRIINNNHSNLGEWYRKAQSILRDNEKLWLKFNLLTGLRKQESIISFNLIISQAKQGKLSYYNREHQILEHFKLGKLFLRTTKNCYISIVPEDLIEQISNSQPVNYYTMRKRMIHKKQGMQIKEQRSYYATYLRKHGVLSEYIDLLQGRIPKSVFARHYLKIADLKALSQQILAVTATIENELEKTLLTF